MKVIITKLEGNEVNQVEGVGNAAECIELARQIDKDRLAQPIGARPVPVEVTIPSERIDRMLAEIEQDLISNGLLPALQEKPEEEQPPKLASGETEPPREPEHAADTPAAEVTEPQENADEIASEEQPQEGYCCDDTEDPWTEVRKWLLEHGYTGEAISNLVNECKKNKVEPSRALEALKWEK